MGANESVPQDQQIDQVVQATTAAATVAPSFFVVHESALPPSQQQYQQQYQASIVSTPSITQYDTGPPPTAASAVTTNHGPSASQFHQPMSARVIRSTAVAVAVPSPSHQAQFQMQQQQQQQQQQQYPSQYSYTQSQPQQFQQLPQTQQYQQSQQPQPAVAIATPLNNLQPQHARIVVASQTPLSHQPQHQQNHAHLHHAHPHAGTPATLSSGTQSQAAMMMRAKPPNTLPHYTQSTQLYQQQQPQMQQQYLQQQQSQQMQQPQQMQPNVVLATIPKPVVAAAVATPQQQQQQQQRPYQHPLSASSIAVAAYTPVADSTPQSKPAMTSADATLAYLDSLLSEAKYTSASHQENVSMIAAQLRGLQEKTKKHREIQAQQQQQQPQTKHLTTNDSSTSTNTNTTTTSSSSASSSSSSSHDSPNINLQQEGDDSFTCTPPQPKKQRVKQLASRHDSNSTDPQTYAPQSLLMGANGNCTNEDVTTLMSDSLFQLHPGSHIAYTQEAHELPPVLYQHTNATLFCDSSNEDNNMHIPNNAMMNDYTSPGFQMMRDGSEERCVMEDTSTQEVFNPNSLFTPREEEHEQEEEEMTPSSSTTSFSSASTGVVHVSGTTAAMPCDGSSPTSYSSSSFSPLPTTPSLTQSGPRLFDRRLLSQVCLETFLKSDLLNHIERNYASGKFSIDAVRYQLMMIHQALEPEHEEMLMKEFNQMNLGKFQAQQQKWLEESGGAGATGQQQQHQHAHKLTTGDGAINTCLKLAAVDASQPPPFTAPTKLTLEPPPGQNTSSSSSSYTSSLSSSTALMSSIAPHCQSIVHKLSPSLPRFRDNLSPHEAVDDDPDGVARLRIHIILSGGSGSSGTGGSSSGGEEKRKRKKSRSGGEDEERQGGGDDNQQQQTSTSMNDGLHLIEHVGHLSPVSSVTSSAAAAATHRALPPSSSSSGNTSTTQPLNNVAASSLSVSQAAASAPIIYRLMYCNRAFERMSGWTQAELVELAVTHIGGLMHSLRSDHLRAFQAIVCRWRIAAIMEAHLYQVRLGKDGRQTYCLCHIRVQVLNGMLHEATHSFMPLPEDDPDHPMPPFVEGVDLDEDTLLYGYKPPAKA